MNKTHTQILYYKILNLWLQREDPTNFHGIQILPKKELKGGHSMRLNNGHQNAVHRRNKL